MATFIKRVHLNCKNIPGWKGYSTFFKEEYKPIPNCAIPYYVCNYEDLMGSPQWEKSFRKTLLEMGIPAGATIWIEGDF